MKNNQFLILVVFTFFLCKICLAAEFDIPADPVNGIPYSYKVITDETYTYQAALDKIAQYTGKPFLVTIESSNELYYIKNMLVQNGVTSTNFWLGGSSMDPQNNNWGWSNGIMRNQPFFRTFPERCYGYCGKFPGGGTDRTKSKLKFYSGDPDLWTTSAPTDIAAIIMEFGPDNSTTPVFQYLDHGSSEIVLSEFASFDQSFTLSLLFSSGTSVVASQTTVVSSANRAVKCVFPIGGVSGVTYVGKAIFTISIGQAHSQYNYYFNAPYFEYVHFDIFGTNRVYMYGNNFKALQPPIKLRFGTDGANFSFNITSADILTDQNPNVIRPSFGGLSYPLTPLILTQTGLMLKVNNLPFVTKGLLYHYNPIPVSYSEALTMSNGASLMRTNGYLAYLSKWALASTMNNYIPNVFPTTKLWTNLVMTGPGTYKYSTYTTGTSSDITIDSSAGSASFYFDYQQNKTIGISATNPLLLPFLAVFGILPPQPNQNSIVIPTYGASVFIPMISGYGTPISLLKVVPNKYPTSVYTGNVDYVSTRVVIPINGGTGSNLLAKATVSMGLMDPSEYCGSFNFKYSYMAPQIISVVSSGGNPGNLTITGQNFGSYQSQVSVSGIACTPTNLTLDANSLIYTLTCSYITFPRNVVIDIVVTVDGQNSPGYPFQPLFINSVNPGGFSLDGGIVEIGGNGFSKDTGIDINLLGIGVPCVNPTFGANNVSCTIPPFNRAQQFDLSVKLIPSGETAVYGPLSYQKIIVNEVIQGSSTTISVIGDNFSLFNNIKITVGGGIPDSITIANDTLITFVVNEKCKNGYIVFQSQYGNDVLSFFKVFDPIIISIVPAPLDPAVTSTIKAYFVDTNYNIYIRRYTIAIILPSYQRIDNTTFEFQPSQLAGKDYAIYFVSNYNDTISSMSSDAIVSYKPPTITFALALYDISNPATNYCSISVFGNYFGIDDSKLSISGLAAYGPVNVTTTEMNYKSCTFKCPTGTRSGAFAINVDGQISSYQSISIRPYPTSISPVPISGGVITINGYFLGPTSYNGDPALAIEIGNGICKNIQMINNVGNYYTLTCRAGPGTGKFLSTFTSLTAAANLLGHYEEPFIQKVTSTYFKEAGNVTITGSGFANVGLSVTIGGVQCNNTVVVSTTEIICYFDSEVTGTSLAVNVTVDSQSYQSYSFIYLVKPSKCPDCGVNGVCDESQGKCNCINDYIGTQCNIKLNKNVPVDVPKPVDTNTTAIQLGSTKENIQFNVNITEIREINPSGQVFKSYMLKDIKWNHLTEENDTFIYSGSFEGNTDFAVNVSIHIITNATNYNFAGDIFILPENSAKYEVTLINYKFNSTLNKLEVLFLSQMPIETQDGCNSKKSAITGILNNTDSSLRQIEVRQSSGILTAYFSDRMIVDSRVLHSSVSILSEDDPSMVSLRNIYPNKLNVLTAIQIVYFDDQATIDPSFDSILALSENSNGGCGEEDNKWKIPVIATVCAVGGVTIIAAITIVLLKKYKYSIKISSIKMRSMVSRKSSKFSVG